MCVYVCVCALVNMSSRGIGIYRDLVKPVQQTTLADCNDCANSLTCLLAMDDIEDSIRQASILGHLN